MLLADRGSYPSSVRLLKPFLSVDSPSTRLFDGKGAFGSVRDENPENVRGLCDERVDRGSSGDRYPQPPKRPTPSVQILRDFNPFRPLKGGWTVGLSTVF